MLARVRTEPLPQGRTEVGAVSREKRLFFWTLHRNGAAIPRDWTLDGSGQESCQVRNAENGGVAAFRCLPFHGHGACDG